MSARCVESQSPTHYLITPLRYEFISYSDSYDDYLMALGTPSWVLGLAKASSERITVSSGVEGDSLKWHFKTGEMYVLYIGNIQKK